jgi:pyruvate/2-oxoglutarate dehydrogenase complex dihydrolipoamide dehydrogenase (E3) component
MDLPVAGREHLATSDQFLELAELPRRIASLGGGFTVLCHGAEELINQFALAMRAGLTAADLKGMIFSYPSQGSDLQSMV